MSWYVYLIGIVVLIALSAFCSGSEMAFSSANRMRLENLMEDGSHRAKVAYQIVDRFDSALSAILIGNNLVNIGASSLASVLAFALAGNDSWSWLATILLTLAVIIFGETIPKILAKKNANRFALRFAYAVRIMMLVLAPVVLLVVGLVKLITLPLKGEKQDDDDEDAASQELQSIFETAEDEEVIDEERSELLQAALDFSDVMASEAMTARVDMVAIDIDDDWSEIREILNSTPYSRLPVYEDSVDNIIGFLYLNRLFREQVDALLESGAEQPPADLRSLLIEPCFVYKTTKLPQVLSELRRQKKHLAVVTDEYGGTLGVITMEDVLEQLVGEIWDETDTVETEVVARESGEYELDGDMVISDFLELLGWDEDAIETESATVGGWTLERFGAFPLPGDSFEADGLHVTVLAMDNLRVERVLVRKLPAEAED